MKKLQVKESMTGFGVLRAVENHLFEGDNPSLGNEFWKRGRDTVIHTDNQNSCGWAGHRKDDVIKLAAEFGIEVELIK